MHYSFRLLIATALLNSPRPAAAQQPLNLGFEKESPEGAARPWGWAYYQIAPQAEAAMDSTIACTGKYSFRITGKEKNGQASPHTLGYWIDPWALKGKQLELRGWIKTENLTGNARITLSAWGEAESPGADTVEAQAAPGNPLTTPWRPFQMEIKVDSLSYSAAVTVELEGSGNIWFDAFALFADGEAMEEAPVAPGFSPAQMEWLSRHSAPLRKIDATP